MAAGRLPLSSLISHRIPWNQMQTAYDLASDRSKTLVAAVLDWRPLSER
jgi:threonine dehydrogenase-like Zn-dependent dehydrogenase